MFEADAGRLVPGADGNLGRAGGGISVTLSGTGGGYIDGQLTFSRYETTLMSDENGDRLHARIGVAIDFQDAVFIDTEAETAIHVSATGNLHRELFAGPEVAVSGVTLSGGHADLTGEVGLGSEVNWNGALSSARVEALASTDLAHPRRTYCLGASAGLQLRY